MFISNLKKMSGHVKTSQSPMDSEQYQTHILTRIWVWQSQASSNHHTYNFLETHNDIAATARYQAGFAVTASSNTNNIKTISRPSYLKTIFNFLFACIQSRHPATITQASRERKWQVAIFLVFYAVQVVLWAQWSLLLE